MKTIFAFDTATSTAACALVRDGRVVGERRLEARSVLAAADELARAAGITPSGIDALVVGTGPGSFTSIRIGLATARGLGLALDVPAAGVSTLHAYAGGQPVIDARRGEVFTDGPTVVRPEELHARGRTLVGDGAVRYRDVFEAAGAIVPGDDDAAHLPSAARLVAHAGAFAPADELAPLYVRAPDARPTR